MGTLLDHPMVCMSYTSAIDLRRGFLIKRRIECARVKDLARQSIDSTPDIHAKQGNQAFASGKST